MEGNLLFNMLSTPARRAIFLSMSLQMVSGGTTIITQGDMDATRFYVLEKGTCDVLVGGDAAGKGGKKVHTYPSGRQAARLTSSTAVQAVQLPSDAHLVH